MILKNLFITGLLFFTGQAAFALDPSIVKTRAYQQLTQPQKETYQYDHYFVFASAASVNIESVNLADFKRVADPFPQPAVPYDREGQFGEWIRPDKTSCLNTRGVVLTRQSQVDVIVNEKCLVVSGQWYDPYTDKTFNDAAEIHIDHVVALKNAYMTGAHSWDSKKRCLYSNYLGNDIHLLPVNGPENMRKSDKSPLEYMPPNSKFICEYLRNWLEIKYIWNLRMTPREVNAIQNEIKSNNCTEQDMTITTSEVKQQHHFMQANKDLCQ